ncbi:hypothetical protein [Lentzea sp. CC55]|uniref:hypothetical protein n=1 Tax=Lentzea sp. CC55 TaxID=2884909 RepID=UPI001F392517|nr:hypothetical protein [Lentzea sp. CC55]MCG8925814.1 hypothetical protein [Lentzea sp. CC55]
MTARLARAESVPGSGLDEAPGRFRLHLALMLRRLRDNATPLGLAHDHPRGGVRGAAHRGLARHGAGPGPER